MLLSEESFGLAQKFFTAEAARLPEQSYDYDITGFAQLATDSSQSEQSPVASSNQCGSACGDKSSALPLFTERQLISRSPEETN